MLLIFKPGFAALTSSIYCSALRSFAFANDGGYFSKETFDLHGFVPRRVLLD
jgi:hypothetical protein